MNEQSKVALAIVAVLGLLGVGLIVAGLYLKDAGPAWGGVGTVIGALATALNTPGQPRSGPPTPPPADPQP